MKTAKLTFEEWFKQGQDSLINLFCEFIRGEKASGITLEQFARFMFTQTTHGITSEHENVSPERSCHYCDEVMANDDLWDNHAKNCALRSV